MQGLTAVRALHGQGVLHCDLKPDNLLLSRSGQLLLNDYDLACYSSHPHRLHVGSPLFMSPRLQEEHFPLYTTDDDMLALGLTFAHLLKVHFDAESCKSKWTALRTFADIAIMQGSALTTQIADLIAVHCPR